jgi:hypothetical protein
MAMTEDEREREREREREGGREGGRERERVRARVCMLKCSINPITNTNLVYNHYIFFVIPLYLQSVPVHSVNCVQTYIVSCRRVLSSAPL